MFLEKLPSVPINPNAAFILSLLLGLLHISFFSWSLILSYALGYLWTILYWNSALVLAKFLISNFINSSDTLSLANGIYSSFFFIKFNCSSSLTYFKYFLSLYTYLNWSSISKLLNKSGCSTMNFSLFFKYFIILGSSVSKDPSFFISSKVSSWNSGYIFQKLYCFNSDAFFNIFVCSSLNLTILGFSFANSICFSIENSFKKVESLSNLSIIISWGISK